MNAKKYFTNLTEEISTEPTSRTQCHKLLDLHWRMCGYSLFNIILSSLSAVQQSADLCQSLLASPELKLFPFEAVRICWKSQIQAPWTQCEQNPMSLLWVHIPESVTTTGSFHCPHHVRHTLLRFEWLSAGGAARLLRWWGKVGISSGSQAAQRSRQTTLMTSSTSQGQGLQLIHVQNMFTHVEVSLWSRNSPDSLWQSLWIRETEKNQLSRTEYIWQRIATVLLANSCKSALWLCFFQYILLIHELFRSSHFVLW